jgi:predicted nucleotidyltransferase
MDPATCLEPLRERARERERQARERERQARRALPALVRLLVDRYGARRIVLVGSLADGRFDHRSDVDLVVEGLTFEQALDAWGEAGDAAGLPVDLLRAESLSSEWRAYHERYGEVLLAS